LTAQPARFTGAAKQSAAVLRDQGTDIIWRHGEEASLHALKLPVHIGRKI
jgi:hypothetical protein